jgi:multidrug efflux pump subunit AcrB
MAGLRPHLEKARASLPPGYRLEVGGEEEEQLKGFGSLQLVLLICVVSIFLALVIQFKSATKPLIVFSAIPFGVTAALVSLKIMGAPFGFMAFLGCISLIGVIVSHVIVLFDFIEERHHEGDSLRDALIDAGILRLRPVLITVAATVFGLRADRRADRGHRHHPGPGAGALHRVREGPEARDVGRGSAADAGGSAR